MGLSFRQEGLVWLHAQSTVYLGFIKRAIDVSTEPMMKCPPYYGVYLCRWGGVGALVILRQLVSNP